MVVDQACLDLLTINPNGTIYTRLYIKIVTLFKVYFYSCSTDRKNYHSSLYRWVTGSPGALMPPTDTRGLVPPSLLPFCEQELDSLAVVRFQMDKESVTSVKQDVRVTFASQLSDLGGLVALFTGMSLLSVVEVMIWVIKLSFEILSGKMD